MLTVWHVCVLGRMTTIQNMKNNVASLRPAIWATERATRGVWSGNNQDSNYRPYGRNGISLKGQTWHHDSSLFRTKSWSSRLSSFSSPTVRLFLPFVFFLPKCQRGSALIIGGEQLCWTQLRSKINLKESKRLKRKPGWCTCAHRWLWIIVNNSE